MSGLAGQFEHAEFRKMLSEDTDPKNAILTINAGAGRHGVAGLGADAFAHVPALGAGQGL